VYPSLHGQGLFGSSQRKIDDWLDQLEINLYRLIDRLQAVYLTIHTLNRGFIDMKNLISLLGVTLLFWTQTLVAQQSECEGNFIPDKAKLTRNQLMQMWADPSQVWPPLTPNDYVFIYANGSTCFVHPLSGYVIDYGRGQVFSEGATAFCKSNSQDIVSQCIPTGVPPGTGQFPSSY
jgi:hypothetical protein